jgi:N-dimethylarginine dimethylaminohydrolase
VRFGVHHEWGKLREAVVGLSPAEDLVVFREESARWLSPDLAALASRHAGRRLIDIDAEWAKRCERQVDALADLLGREGVTVHRPARLEGEERTVLARNGDGAQLFVRDPLIVVADHLIEGSLRLTCRQRERFGLRLLVQQAVQQRGARWSSVPPGWPNGVDGPFLEGGDTLLNGYEVYVGMSGCASDLAGADWLQALLGERYRIVPVAMRSNVLHLDCCLSLVKPGLLVCCPGRLIDGLPMSLREWDKIEVSIEEASRLATNGLVLEAGRMIVDSDNSRLAAELRKRRLDVIPLPFDGPIRLGGGLRATHHPLLRESALA